MLNTSKGTDCNTATIVWTGKNIDSLNQVNDDVSTTRTTTAQKKNNKDIEAIKEFIHGGIYEKKYLDSFLLIYAFTLL